MCILIYLNYVKGTYPVRTTTYHKKIPPENNECKITLQKIHTFTKAISQSRQIFLDNYKNRPSTKLSEVFFHITKMDCLHFKVLTLTKAPDSTYRWNPPCRKSGSYRSVLVLLNQTTLTKIFTEHLPTLGHKSTRFCTHKANKPKILKGDHTS